MMGIEIRQARLPTPSRSRHSDVIPSILPLAPQPHHLIMGVLRPRCAPPDPRDFHGVAPRLWSGIVELPGAPLFASTAAGVGGETPMEVFAELAGFAFARVRDARPPPPRSAPRAAIRHQEAVAWPSQAMPPAGRLQGQGREERGRSDVMMTGSEANAGGGGNSSRDRAAHHPQHQQRLMPGTAGRGAAGLDHEAARGSVQRQQQQQQQQQQPSKAASARGGSGGGGGGGLDDDDDDFMDEPSAASSRKESRCSECKQTGHNKRSCPNLADDDMAKDAPSEKPKAKKPRSTAAEPLSAAQINSSFEGMCINAGMVECSVLEDILEQIQGRQYVVFGVVYGSMHTNTRPVPKGTPTCPTPKACRKVMGATLYLPIESDSSPTERAGQRKGRMLYVPLDQQACYSCTLEQRWRLLQKVFSDEVGAKLVAYHAHECLVQLLPGLIPGDVMRKKMTCLVVLSWLIDSEKAKPPFLDLVASHGGGIAVASADSGPKGARVWEDMEACGAVFERLSQDVASKGLGRASNNEEAFVPVLAVMQSQGLGFSPAVLLRHKTDMEKAVAALEEEAARVVGHPVLLSSPQQVCAVLYEELKLPPPSSRAGEVGAMNKFKAANQTHTTNEETLQRLTKLHPLPGIILEHRHVNKMLTGFMTPLAEKAVNKQQSSQDTGGGSCTIYTNFLHTGTATGRLSSADPNLQNIPKIDSSRFEGRTDISSKINVRDAFVGRAGKMLLSADYVQCEIRILAHLSNDSKLIALLQDPEACPYVSVASCVTGKPTSSVTAMERSTFKTVMLGLVYGLGVKTLASKLGMSEKEAYRHINQFYTTFPAVKTFQNRVVSDARKSGYVETWGGRRRGLPDLQLSGQAMSGRRSYAERQAVNTVVQGSAADMVKQAMVHVSLALEEQGMSDRARMCLQIHDEILLELEEGLMEEVAGIVEESMVGGVKLKVPMRVKIVAGKTWGGMEAYPGGAAALRGDDGAEAEEGGLEIVDDEEMNGVDAADAELSVEEGQEEGNSRDAHAVGGDSQGSRSNGGAHVHDQGGTDVVASVSVYKAPSADNGSNRRHQGVAGAGGSCGASGGGDDVDAAVQYGRHHRPPTVPPPKGHSSIRKGDDDGLGDLFDFGGGSSREAIKYVDVRVAGQTGSWGLPETGEGPGSSSAPSAPCAAIAPPSMRKDDFSKGMATGMENDPDVQAAGNKSGAGGRAEERVSLFGGMIQPSTTITPLSSQSSRPPLHDIAVGGLNTRVFAANKLAGGLHGTVWAQNPSLAPSLKSSSIVDDDLDQLEID